MSKGTGTMGGALSALFAASVCALSGTALAQDVAQETGEVSVSADSSGVGSRSPGAVGPLRFNAGFHLGFGGGARTKVEGGGFENESTVDLAVTPGLQAGADYVIMDYFSLGGELRLAWMKPQDVEIAGMEFEADRATVFDLVVKPKGRYAFSNIPLEVYGALPLGLSVLGGTDNTDSDAGFTLGFGPGATYFFTDNIGINTEMLGVFRWFGDSDEQAGVDVDVSNRLGQFTWFFNAVYAL